jgi:hypothetical protein
MLKGRVVPSAASSGCPCPFSGFALLGVYSICIHIVTQVPGYLALVLDWDGCSDLSILPAGVSGVHHGPIW